MGGEILRRQARQNRFFSTRSGALCAIVIFVGLAVVAAWLDPPPAPITGQARASDGDTIRVATHRIRLLGLDAPELRQTCTDAAGLDYACGERARDRLERLLAGGPVDCDVQDRDQYQRDLAYCSVNGKDLGAVIVAEGHAVAAGSYWTEEQSARQARRGVWAGDFDAPRHWRADHPQGQRGFGWLSRFGL